MTQSAAAFDTASVYAVHNIHRAEAAPVSPRIRVGEASTLIKQEAIRQGVPVALALATAHVESRTRCNAVGPATKYGRAQGPLQILPSSARALGYHGPLNNCGNGLRAGMAHLAMCYRLAGGSKPLAARCHVAGPAGLNNRSSYANWYVRAVMAAI